MSPAHERAELCDATFYKELYTIGPQTDGFGLTNYCFLRDARRIDVKRAELMASGNVSLVEDWVCAQYEAMDDRFLHGVKLYDFLRKWEFDEKAEAIISERKDAIKKRTIEQSIPDVEGFDNIHRSVYVLWKTIVEQPRPVTERGWKMLKPVVAKVLDESQFCHYDDEDVNRQRICSERLSELLGQIASEYMPLKPIATALGIDAVSTSAPAASTDRIYYLMLTPHPNQADALEWECLRLFENADFSRHQTDEIFGQRSDIIAAEIESWRIKVITELGQIVSVSNSGRKKKRNDVRLMQNTLRLRSLWIWGVGSGSPGLSGVLLSAPEHVSSRGAHAPEHPELSGGSGSNPKIRSVGSAPGLKTILLSSVEPGATLDSSTRQLLRADCVFKASRQHPLYSILYLGKSHYVPLPLFFPDLLVTRRDIAWDIADFEAYPDAKRVAKELLKHLGMEDAAHVEMKTMGSRFVCGRCADRKARDWNGIIGHYLEEQRRRRHTQEQSSIPITQIHNLSHHIDKPLVEIVSSKDAGETTPLSVFVPPKRPLLGIRGYRFPYTP
ncbi:hypothetical protein FRC09_013758 [Ceratobasidium sp. 395]|nr:hypothetical protein FRC09_013758 [Ceratobasidium sp. 395]